MKKIRILKYQGYGHSHATVTRAGAILLGAWSAFGLFAASGCKIARAYEVSGSVHTGRFRSVEGVSAMMGVANVVAASTTTTTTSTTTSTIVTTTAPTTTTSTSTTTSSTSTTIAVEIPAGSVTTTTIPASVICDPFGSGTAGNTTGIPGLGTATTALNGLMGDIYYLSHAVGVTPAPVPTKTGDIISSGIKVSEPVYFKNLYRPESDWDSGFIDLAGNIVKDSYGQKVVDYFAISLKTELRLPTGYPAGYYQLAMITDDGAVLLIDTKPFIDSDSVHTTQMACGPNAIYLMPGLSLPVQINYMQTAPWKLTLTMVWRKVADFTSASSASVSSVPIYDTLDHSVVLDPKPDDCKIDYTSQSYPYGPTHPGYFSFWNAIDVNPTSRIQDMYNRGWEVVPPGAFYLPTGNLNPCP